MNPSTPHETLVWLIGLIFCALFFLLAFTTKK